MNSPAARLHGVLALCKKHEKESETRPMLMGWRKVFRMAESVRDFAVMERIGRVYGLAGEIADLIGRFEDLDPQLYLGWREELEDAFLNLSFRSEFGTFVKRVPKTLLVNIEFCANALSERCPEPMVDAEVLIELSKTAGEIIRELSGSDLDNEGKRYFHDYLTLIRRAADDYTLTGASGLQGALDACTGTLVTQRHVSIPTRESPIGKRFWSLTNKISKALAAPDEEAESNPRGIKAVVRKRVA